MRNLILLTALAFITSANPTINSLCEGYLPPNNWRIPKSVKSGLTEDQFNNVLDKVEQVFVPIVATYGGRLSITRLWDSSQVNAFAYQEGANFFIEMHGGLSRHSQVTPDSLTLVACHEIGHHIGGAPKITSQGGDPNITNEGQSDYYATLKCLRILWENENNQLTNPDPVAVSECSVSFTNQKDINICVRATMAGLSSSSMFSSLGNTPAPSLNRKDSNRVSSTSDSHPQPQCRLDTYFAASTCQVDKNTEVNQKDPNQGTCSRENGDSAGVRPLCWYAPAGVSQTAKQPTLNGQNELTLQSMSEQVRVYIDVRDLPEAGGVYLEFSKPNQSFTNPNGVAPDPQALGGYRLRGKEGYYTFAPSTFLPSMGKYEIRVFPLNSSGTAVVGKASQASLLVIEPDPWRPWLAWQIRNWWY